MILEKIKEYGNHFSFYVSSSLAYLLSHDFFDSINYIFSTIGVVVGTIYSCFLLFVLIRDKICTKKK